MSNTKICASSLAKGIIKLILEESDIHHNISTRGMKLPERPEGCENELFWKVCGQLIDAFTDEWEQKPESDMRNRNLCECRKHYPERIRRDGACLKHNIWHIYQHGRMGATLYWEKYWESSNNGFSFRYSLEELQDMPVNELRKMAEEINKFNRAVAILMNNLPAALKSAYNEWTAQQKKEALREAMGYNKTLGELLEDANPQIIRLAKGIKKELTK